MQIDTIGIPEFWASIVGEMEIAGDGLVRFVVCAKRHEEIVPVYSVVMPAVAVLRAIPEMDAFCRHSLEVHAGADH